MLDLAADALNRSEDRGQMSAFRMSTASRQVKEELPPRWGRVGPKDYAKTYASLPKMSAAADRLQTAFGNGAAGHNVPLISRRSLEVMPGVHSFDPLFLQFLRELSEALNAEFVPDLDNEGFTKSGVHTTFDRLRCPAGYFMNPMSYTAVDNSNYREELGLNAGYTPRQRQIAEEVWRLTWAEVEVTPVNVPKLSTGGARRFTFDVQWKLAFVEWLMVPDRFEKMLNAVQSADWQTLANEFETLYMTYIQKRGQVDTPGKQRMVFDLDYAISGGSRGEPYPADKKVVIDGRSYADFSAIRARVVHAGPWVINCFLQMIATSTMRSLFRRFPSTFHVNTAEEIKAVVEGKYIMCSDVTEYDRSMSRDSLSVPHYTMKETWDERLVAASWRLVTAPYYSKPLDIAGKRGTWVKDPTDWSQEVFAGNRSGHALTSLFAKVNKVIDTLFIIDHIYPVLGRCKEVLEGKMPIGMVNNGDDEIVWALTASDMERFRALRADLSKGHYVVNPEDGQGYSGLLLVKVGPTSYDPRPRIHTTFEKIWVPERSIGGRHRRYWPIGMMARIDNIMSTELGRRAWEIHMKVHRDVLAPHYGDLMQVLGRSVATMDLELDALTSVDKEVLDSPDKIHHKYAADEVSPDVLDKITSKVPIEVVGGFIEKYYSGVIT